MQNILDDTIQQLFTQIQDTSYNVLNEWIGTVNTSIFDTTIPLNRATETEIENNEDDSIPNLIEPEQEDTPDTNPINQIPSNQGLQLWANVLEDYHSQMRMYQENVRTILDITQTLLPQVQRQPRTPVYNNTDNSIWRNLFRNSNTYTIDIERLIPSLFSINIPSSTQIQNATTVFICDLSNNPLTSQICPISLEEFRDGESLTKIIYCGHIFKTNELSRWFQRNSHCPSCRYNIRQN
jgi:hypothetical protein